MDTAYVPLNAMTQPSAWHVQLGVLPSGEGYDPGTVVSMSHVSGHGWVAYTKRNDIIGSTWSGSTPGTSPGPGTSPPSGGRPSPRPDADGPTRPRPTRPARPRPAQCSCHGPAITMTLARHATCSPSSPTCLLAHPRPVQTARGGGPPTGADIRFRLRPRTERIVRGVSSSERKGGAVDVRPDSRAFRRPLTPGGRRHLPHGEMP
jgi:hypothetical protein